MQGDHSNDSFTQLFFTLYAHSGFVDIFSKSKDRLKAHASKILKFLHRNRIPSNVIPFPVLDGYNSICTMRASVVQDFLDYLLQKEKGEGRGWENKTDENRLKLTYKQTTLPSHDFSITTTNLLNTLSSL